MSAYREFVEKNFSSGLVLFQPLNEATGTEAKDASGNGHPGTYNGGFTLGAEGPFSGETAVALNGTTGYISTTAAAALHPSKVTIALWYKPTFVAGTKGSGLAQLASGTKFGFEIGYGIGPTETTKLAVGTYQASPQELEDGEPKLNAWHFIMGTFDNATIKLYLDGAKGLSKTSGGGAEFEAAEPMTAGRNAPGTKFLKGSLALIAVWNRALSEAEYLELWNVSQGVLVNSSLPIIFGPAVQNQVEFESHGTYINGAAITEFRLQWYRCNSSGGEPIAIVGATERSYIPTSADVGRTLKVEETAVDPAGNVIATSAASPVIAAVPAPTTTTTQPEVEEPVLRWPFRMAGDESHIIFIEQDTPTELEQCVGLVLTANPPNATFPDAPDFGLPDPTFMEGGISEADLLTVIRRWESRAEAFMTEDELIGTAQQVGIEVKPT